MFQSLLEEFPGFFVHPVLYDLLQVYLCIIGEYDIVITHADTLSLPRDERESVVTALVEHFPFVEDLFGLRNIVSFPQLALVSKVESVRHLEPEWDVAL